jgi:hypothetical protein
MSPEWPPVPEMRDNDEADYSRSHYPTLTILTLCETGILVGNTAKKCASQEPLQHGHESSIITAKRLTWLVRLVYVTSVASQRGSITVRTGQVKDSGSRRRKTERLMTARRKTEHQKYPMYIYIYLQKNCRGRYILLKYTVRPSGAYLATVP